MRHPLALWRKITYLCTHPHAQTQILVAYKGTTTAVEYRSSTYLLIPHTLIADLLSFVHAINEDGSEKIQDADSGAKDVAYEYDWRVPILLFRKGMRWLSDADTGKREKVKMMEWTIIRYWSLHPSVRDWTNDMSSDFAALSIVLGGSESRRTSHTGRTMPMLHDSNVIIWNNVYLRTALVSNGSRVAGTRVENATRREVLSTKAP